MDMSVKLNLSYPALWHAEQAGDKPLLDKSVSPSGEAGRGGDLLRSAAVPDAKQVQDAVSDIAAFFSSTRRNLEFSTDEESGKLVVKIIASDTGELVRQLPSEEALRIARSLSDVSSLLFDAKV